MVTVTILAVGSLVNIVGQAIANGEKQLELQRQQRKHQLKLQTEGFAAQKKALLRIYNTRKEISEDRIRLMEDIRKLNFNACLKNYAHICSLSGWPLLTPPLVMYSDVLLYYDENIYGCAPYKPVHVLLAPPKNNALREACDEALNQRLDDFFITHCQRAGGHHVMFYRGAWEPKTQPDAGGTGKLAEQIHAGIPFEPTIVITVRVASGGMLRLNVTYWGIVPAQPTAPDEKIATTVPATLELTLPVPCVKIASNKTYTEAEASSIVDTLATNIAALTCQLVDVYAWLQYRTAPQLPALLVSGAIKCTADDISKAYSDYAALIANELQACSAYLPVDTVALLRYCDAVDQVCGGQKVMDAIVKPYTRKPEAESIDERTACFGYIGPVATKQLIDYCYLHRRYYGFTKLTLRTMEKTWFGCMLTDRCRAAFTEKLPYGYDTDLGWEDLCYCYKPGFERRCKDVEYDVLNMALNWCDRNKHTPFYDEVRQRVAQEIKRLLGEILPKLRQRAKDYMLKRVDDAVSEACDKAIAEMQPHYADDCREAAQTVRVYMKGEFVREPLDTHYEQRYDLRFGWDFGWEAARTLTDAWIMVPLVGSDTVVPTCNPDEASQKAIDESWDDVVTIAKYYAGHFLDEEWKQLPHDDYESSWDIESGFTPDML